MKRICSIALATALLALAAAAQEEVARPVMVKVIGPDMSVLAAPVTGAPYSADEITTFTQTLADGTHIEREEKATVYRDSEGRLRRETPTEVSISDPVAGVSYALDPVKLTARKLNEAVRVVARPAAGTGAERPMKSLSFSVQGNSAYSGPTRFIFDAGSADSAAAPNRQSLGSQTIEGVLAQGTSANQTIAAGSIGNDRDIQVVDERWYSPDLKTTIMTKHSDPRSGEEVFRLTNISRSEPNPSLFQVPAGYRIEDLPIKKAPARP